MVIPNPAAPISFNRYAYSHNNPVKYRDPSGHIIETIWDVANIVIGLGSLSYNLSQGNYTDAAIDAGGLILDIAATAIPVVPGGASAAIKAVRTADKVGDLMDAAKTVNGASNIVQGANQIENTVNAAKQLENAVDIAGTNNPAEVIIFNQKGKPDIPNTRPGRDGKVSCSSCEPGEGIQNSFGREPNADDYYWKVNQQEVVNNGGVFDFDGGQPITDLQGRQLGGEYPDGHVSITFPNEPSKGQVEKKLRNWLDGPYPVIE